MREKDKKCNRRLVTVELVLFVLEMLKKIHDTITHKCDPPQDL